MLSRLLRAPLTWVFVAVLGAGAALGLYWFQPWKLFTDSYVEEALPVVAGAPTAGPSGDATAPRGTDAPEDGDTGAPGDSTGSGRDGGAPGDSTGSGRDGGAPGDSPARPRLLATGDFVTHEHRTTGDAQLVLLPNGRHQLVLRDLDTSNGPDLRVWLTDQPVRQGRAGWRVFDDGRWVELARLKGNRGDQVYDIPASVRPEQFRSVSIWCRRFAVSFGAAELKSR